MKLLVILAMVLIALPMAYAVTSEPNCCVFCVGQNCVNAPIGIDACTSMGQCIGNNCPDWTVSWEYQAICNYNCPEVPEFGTVTALIGLAGAVTGYFVIKKK